LTVASLHCEINSVEPPPRSEEYGVTRAKNALLVDRRTRAYARGIGNIVEPSESGGSNRNVPVTFKTPRVSAVIGKG
jgi:hypothetical protein